MSKLSDAAERNKAPILELLRRVLPPRGLVLEVASGTGQHVAHFAAALPRLTWQPSDVDLQDFRFSGLSNVLEPLVLDVCHPWPLEHAEGVVCSNMIHIAPWEATLALIEGTAGIGAEVLFLYGPYRRSDRPTAPSNEAFDASLRAHDPRWGLRSVEAVAEAASGKGLRLDEIVEMPANNLSLVFRPARSGRSRAGT
jgi:Protein of unknown function (DUF938)